KIKDKPDLKLNDLSISQSESTEYLGLPIGDGKFVNDFVEEKWKKVEKSFYSLYGLGYKPKMTSPDLLGFLYKQFCQSIFRYHLDTVWIGADKLSEFETRQNLLLKRALGIKKFARFRPMLEAIKCYITTIFDALSYKNNKMNAYRKGKRRNDENQDKKTNKQVFYFFFLVLSYFPTKKSKNCVNKRISCKISTRVSKRFQYFYSTQWFLNEYFSLYP
ncbi:hypothetical protein BpHYR1_002046, partial [Brachionus plicatilis]